VLAQYKAAIMSIEEEKGALVWREIAVECKNLQTRRKKDSRLKQISFSLWQWKGKHFHDQKKRVDGSY